MENGANKKIQIALPKEKATRENALMELKVIIARISLHIMDAEKKKEDLTERLTSAYNDQEFNRYWENALQDTDEPR